MRHRRFSYPNLTPKAFKKSSLKELNVARHVAIQLKIKKNVGDLKKEELF